MKKNNSEKNNSILEDQGHKEKYDLIKLNKDSFIFNFDIDGFNANKHRLASGGYGVSIDFKRTVRVPDDGKDYPLPAGLGNFEIRSASGVIDNQCLNDIEDYYMIPMHKEEALWINFNCLGYEQWPCLVKVSVGMINAITGKTSKSDKKKKIQDYMVVPEQPWLDGFKVEDGTVRQFVALERGKGFTFEEQITNKDKFGGLKIDVCPMKYEVLKNLIETREDISESIMEYSVMSYCEKNSDNTLGMGLGGRIKQSIEVDPYEYDSWDFSRKMSVFIHLISAKDWKNLTGEEVPKKTLTSIEYDENIYPWFLYEHESDITTSKKMKKLKSIKDFN